MKNILKNGLFVKLFLLIFLAIFLVLFTFTLQTITYQKKMILDSLSSEAKNMAESISFVKKDSMIIDNQVNILEFILEFVKQNEQIENFIVVRKNGNVMSIKKNSWIMLDENNYTQYQTNSVDYRIINSRYINEKVFKYSYPIFISGITWGWFHFEISLDEYNKKIDEMYNNIILLSLTLLFTSLFVSYLITTMVANPIIKLSKLTKEISLGDLSKRAVIKSNDEIGLLAKTFNNMLDSLEKTQMDLKKSHLELENRVAERTIELKELNETLETKVEKEIAKREKQQQLLIQQSKLAAMGEMIGNIAHQWRQPLNALSLVLQNIDFSYKLGELDNDLMDKSMSKANLLTSAMSKTIDDFRNFFRLDKEKKEFSLDKSILNAISLIDATLANNEIKLEFCLSENIFIYGYENEFSQVILNLINNSKDALIERKVEESYIKIYTEKNEKEALIFVEDNGGGIPKQIIDKIFDPYFTTKEEGKGTGIGLYMSKVIIEENMNGRLTTKNIKDGIIFIIAIPLDKA